MMDYQNWSTLRKSVNFVIVLGMTAVVFTEYAWPPAKKAPVAMIMTD